MRVFFASSHRSVFRIFRPVQRRKVLGEQPALVVGVVARGRGAGQIGKALADAGPEVPIGGSSRAARPPRSMSRCRRRATPLAGRHHRWLAAARRRVSGVKRRARDRRAARSVGRPDRRGAIARRRRSGHVGRRAAIPRTRARWNAHNSTASVADDRLQTGVGDGPCGVLRHPSPCTLRAVLAPEEPRHRRRVDRRGRGRDREHLSILEIRRDTKSIRARASRTIVPRRCRAARAGACSRRPASFSEKFGSVQSLGERAANSTRYPVNH